MLACLLGCGYSLHRDAPWGQRRQPKAHSPASTQAGCIPTSFSSKPTPSPVFHRAMISLDLALRHRVVRPAADMSDAVVLEPLAKLARHVRWPVIAQQPWPMQNLDLVQT